jgi:transposase
MSGYLWKIKSLEYRGKLELSIQKWRAEGLTIRQITDRLNKKGSQVSKSSVAIWVSKLEEQLQEEGNPDGIQH